jgi:phosphatidylglycerophosphatase A
MKFLPKAFSTFFGIGYMPVAPGTFASLAAALLYEFLLFRLSWPLYIALIVLMFLGGVSLASRFSGELNRKDPREIVIDEVCGQWIAYFLVPGHWLNIILGFLLFRAFDVLKPYPIRRLEKLPSGLGIMTDDVFAGIYAAVLLHFYLFIK